MASSKAESGLKEWATSLRGSVRVKQTPLNQVPHASNGSQQGSRSKKGSLSRFLSFRAPPSVPGIPIIETLPGEILEDIASYLPDASFHSLSLVSKRFGAQFRFRTVHSGTEHFLSPSFASLLQEPRYGMFTQTLTIDGSYLHPPLKQQWFLAGEEEEVREEAWKTVRDSRLEEVGRVLRSTTRLSTLVLTGTETFISPATVDTMNDLCKTTIRHLQFPVLTESLIDYIDGGLHRVRSLTWQGGTYNATERRILIDAMRKLPNLAAVQFSDARFNDLLDSFFSELVQICPDIKRIEFSNFTNLAYKDLVPLFVHGITHISINPSSEPRHSLPRFISKPEEDSGVTLESWSAGLSKLNSFIYICGGQSTSRAGHLSPRPIALWFPRLAEFLTSTTNLRSLAISSPAFHEAESSPVMSQELMEPILNLQLHSLSLMGIYIGAEKVGEICRACPSLRFLSILVRCQAPDISSFSQHFSKLPELLVLELGITPQSPIKCACGHDTHRHVPHDEEGSALGRLCLRFKPSSGPALVRLLLNGYPTKAKPLRDSTFTQWIGGPTLALRRLEKICGLFTNTRAAMDRVFDPRFWVDLV